jgi:hypothetical protein
MRASHCAERVCTGSVETSACHHEVAGNTGHVVPGSTARAVVVTAAVRGAPTAPTSAPGRPPGGAAAASAGTAAASTAPAATAAEAAMSRRARVMPLVSAGEGADPSRRPGGPG